MRVLLILGAGAIAAAVTSALAQPAAEPAPVPLTAQERGFVLEACDTAEWANKRRFDRFCDFLRKKFEDADKAAADSAKKSDSAAKENANVGHAGDGQPGSR